MNIAEVGQIISTVGFPIVTACGLFWYIVTTTKEMINAINNNTLVITRLLEKMDE